MYCPKCGTQNDEVKFCRGCGENLKVISQAMSGRLPVILASKMDAYFESKNERFRRESILGAVIGALCLLFGINPVTRGGGSLAELHIIEVSMVLLWGFWQHMVYNGTL